MKKLLIILTLLIFALPVYSIDWDIKGRLRFGKEVSVVVPEGVPADYTEYLNSLNEKFKDTWLTIIKATQLCPTIPQEILT